MVGSWSASPATLPSPAYMALAPPILAARPYATSRGLEVLLTLYRLRWRASHPLWRWRLARSAGVWVLVAIGATALLCRLHQPDPEWCCTRIAAHVPPVLDQPLQLRRLQHAVVGAGGLLGLWRPAERRASPRPGRRRLGLRGSALSASSNAPGLPGAVPVCQRGAGRADRQAPPR